MARELIRLTPSARDAVRASRRAWGWRPGSVVVVARFPHGFGFGVEQPGGRDLVRFRSAGLDLAVAPGDVEHFRGLVVSYNPDALFGRPRWHGTNPNAPPTSGCSDPLGATCSAATFRRFHPELYGLRGRVGRWRGAPGAADRDQLAARTSAYLRVGDGRAAVLVETSPVVTAAYCDEMDAVVLLRFPGFVGGGRPLREGDRLVTANLHRPAADGPLAADLRPGPRWTQQYTNVAPLVADFLAAEPEVVEARRRAISDAEYRRCSDLARQAVVADQPIRSGRPLDAGRPAGA